jgi:small-conductance mechanosensitive channel
VGAYRQVAFESEPRPGHAVPTSGDLRRRDSMRPAATARAKSGPGGVAIAYCLVMGFLAVVVGAAASLAVSGSARIAVWCVVTACVAAVSGVSYPVLPVTAVLGAISARVRGPARG